ncbi:MAG: TRAP transporter fused permease subunit [Firmicutes bacterium]|jgi:TRAP transporter 4TM/12TM fusion protein|nr:TRAP transporter fused permease subunit [Bacillota bacterium]
MGSSLAGRFSAIGMVLATGNPKRKLTGFWQLVFRAIAVVFAAFMLYSAGPQFLGTPDMGYRKGLYILAITVMIYIKYPARRSSRPETGPGVVDIALICLSLITFGYFIVNFNSLILRQGSPTPNDIIMGAIAVVVCLESTRRAIGPILTILGALFLAYAYAGPWMPGLLRHVGYSPARIIAEMYSVNGIFGLILETNANYITLFVLFGAFLAALGAEKFFIDFPYALTAGLRGGPAKTAVVASAFFGSISGSATANVTATGTFTIPLMKRAGYPDYVAGAIEPAASSGGMFMPPVMGAAAFLLAQFLEIPYWKVAVVSFVPAAIYFFSVGLICHLEAYRSNIRPVPPSERKNPWEEFKRGWYFIVPIVVLIVALGLAVSPPRAVYWSLLSALAVTFVARLVEERWDFGAALKWIGRVVLRGLEEGAQNTLSIASVTGTIGMIIEVIFLTGLGFMFTSLIVAAARGSILFTIAMAFVACYVLGMGMTVTSAYILVAVMAVPALQSMGVNPLAAHLLCFWYSATSNFTPPVCLAAFAGAAIAKSDPYKTGMTSLKYAAFILILPLWFVYSEILMPNGLNVHAALAMLNAFLATFPYCSTVVGYLVRPLLFWERLLLTISAILLILPEWTTSAVGLAIFIAIWALQFAQHKASVRRAAASL